MTHDELLEWRIAQAERDLERKAEKSDLKLLRQDVQSLRSTVNYAAIVVVIGNAVLHFLG